jgi:hypothetical protein
VPQTSASPRGPFVVTSSCTMRSMASCCVHCTGSGGGAVPACALGAQMVVERRSR